MGLEQAGVDLLQGDVAAEGEAAPAEGDRVRLGARLDRAQAPAPGVGEQLLAADVAVLEAAVAQQRGAGRRGRRRGRRPRPRARGRRTARPRRRRAARRRPAAARPARRAARRASAAPPGGRRSARARRRRRSSPPGRSTRRNSAKARSRSGMWWRTAWPKTRSKLSSSKGSASASVATVVTSVEPERVGGRRQPLQHPRRDVGRGQPLDHPELDQVEREVAGAGADLQRVAEALPVEPAERLDQLQPHLLLADRRRSRCPTWRRTRRRPRRGSGC